MKHFYGWRVVFGGGALQFFQSMLLNQAFGAYLAALVQDTGWSRYIPSGRGVFGFSTIGEAVEALEKIHADPESQRAAAYDIAREYLAPDKVCTPLLESIFAVSR